MAKAAMARETFFALRQEIARIEGTLPERLELPADKVGDGSDRHFLPTGAVRLDAVLGGGLPRAALTEIHGRQSRDAGSVAGFALALAALARKQAAAPSPILWISTGEVLHEGGQPYAPGLLHRFALQPSDLLLASARKTEDALWIAEEAAGLSALSAVLLEVRGTSARLDLTATRRLHHRTRATGRPLYLLRQSAASEPTAAPVRLIVSPAPAGERHTLFGPLAGSLGPPAFTVTVSRSRTSIPATLTLEWNRDEHSFRERQAGSTGRAQDSGAVVSLSSGRTHSAGSSGPGMAQRKRA